MDIKGFFILVKSLNKLSGIIEWFTNILKNVKVLKLAKTKVHYFIKKYFVS